MLQVNFRFFFFPPKRGKRKPENGVDGRRERDDQHAADEGGRFLSDTVSGHGQGVRRERVQNRGGVPDGVRGHDAGHAAGEHLLLPERLQHDDVVRDDDRGRGVHRVQTVLHRRVLGRAVGLPAAGQAGHARVPAPRRGHAAARPFPVTVLLRRILLPVAVGHRVLGPVAAVHRQLLHDRAQGRRPRVPVPVQHHEHRVPRLRTVLQRAFRRVLRRRGAHLVGDGTHRAHLRHAVDLDVHHHIVSAEDRRQFVQHVQRRATPFGR